MGRDNNCDQSKWWKTIFYPDLLKYIGWKTIYETKNNPLPRFTGGGRDLCQWNGQDYF